jgi:hypothetical protein
MPSVNAGDRSEREGVAVGTGEEQGGDDGDGLGGHGEQEPAAVDAALQAGFVAVDDDGDEGGVDEPAQRPMLTHHSAQARSHQPWMTIDAEASTLVAATVVRNAKPLAWLVTSAAKFDQNRTIRVGEQHGEHDVGDGSDRVEDLGEQVEVLLGGGDRDDAGGHDEREVAGEQCGDRRGPALGHVRAYGRR